MMDVLLPHPELSPYIRVYMHRKIDFSKASMDNFHYCMPTHKKFIMLYLGSSINVTFGNGKCEDKKDMMIIGPLSKPVNINFGQEHRLIAIELQNTGQFYLLNGCPINTIMDCNIEADVIFGNKVCELIDKLNDTFCSQKIKTELDQFFINNLKNNKKPFNKTDHLLNQIPDGKSVEELALLAGISTRQLERRYKEKIGMSPSFYNKIRRFDRAYKLKEHNPQMSWTEIAYTSGYFDQMHLIRDFRELSGHNPGAINEILSKQYKGYTDYQIPEYKC